jgi:hypothetical protein
MKALRPTIRIPLRKFDRSIGIVKMTTSEKTQEKSKGLHDPEAKSKTRLLLSLWDLGGANIAVKKGELVQRVQRTHEKASDYYPIFHQLEEQEAIAIAKNKISLTPKGIQILREGLNSAEFEFDRQIGAKTANALLRWMRQMGTLEGSAIAPAGISSYEEFRQVALEVYDRLNRDYNLNDLVPIYRIRRGIGERVTRSQFNDWLLEMQANDILQLQGGSVEDSAPDKIEDSVTTELDGLRCYAKLLTP